MKIEIVASRTLKLERRNGFKFLKRNQNLIIQMLVYSWIEPNSISVHRTNFTNLTDLTAILFLELFDRSSIHV